MKNKFLCKIQQFSIDLWYIKWAVSKGGFWWCTEGIVVIGHIYKHYLWAVNDNDYVTQAFSTYYTSG